MTRPRKKTRRKRDSNLGSSALEADALTARPTRWFRVREREKAYTRGCVYPVCVRWDEHNTTCDSYRF